MAKVIWEDAPEDHDYPAAASYLSLLAPATLVTDLIARLQRAPLAHYKAKDLLRASQLPLLPTDNAHVSADLAKIAANKHLSPILLVRGDLARGTELQIADGYHRSLRELPHRRKHRHPCQIIDTTLQS